MRTPPWVMTLLASLLPLAGSALAEAPKQEPAISIEITGDKEVPLVLYIVPWQNPEAPIPDPPQLDDPSLRPLTPCELSDSLPAEEVAAWQCAERQPK